MYRPSTDGPYLRFKANAALGIPEQTLLLVLLELAKEQFEAFDYAAIVSSKTESDIGKELWGRLHKEEKNAVGQTLMLRTTWYELNRRCGKETGGSARALREEQLERLCEVVVWAHDVDVKKTKRQSYLVSWLVGDDDRIHLALNCRLASALLGQPYAQISLSERLALGRDIAMALHAFLSTTISGGNHLRIGVEKLIERLWPGSATNAPHGTHRRRRKEVADGLKAIGGLDGWTIEWERDDLALVKRHKANVRDKTSHIANKTRAYREQAFAIIPSKNNSLGAFDASGLFFNKNISA